MPGRVNLCACIWSGVIFEKVYLFHGSEIMHVSTLSYVFLRLKNFLGTFETPFSVSQFQANTRFIINSSSHYLSSSRPTVLRAASLSEALSGKPKCDLLGRF